MLRNRSDFRDSEETEPLYGSSGSRGEEEEVKPWNSFKKTSRDPSVGSTVQSKFYDFSVKSLKVFTIILTFFLVLISAVISKGTTLFMTSQIRPNITRAYCNKRLDITKQFIVTIPDVERVTWIWLLIFAYWIPEAGTFIRSLRKCMFKKWDMPKFGEFVTIVITEVCPAIGSAILIFVVFPELDVIKAAMLTNAVCFVPGIVAFFSRKPASVEGSLKMVLDIVSIVAQASSFVIWPLLEEKPILYMIPVSVILISIGWWENFLSEDSPIPFLRDSAKAKKIFENRTYFIYVFVSVLKSLLFLGTVVLIYWWRENQVSFLFDNFPEAFQNHKIRIDEILPAFSTTANNSSPDYSGATKTGDNTFLTTSHMTPIWVWIINWLSTYLCYACGKFACKVMLQDVSYAFPINLVVPVLLSGLIAMCGSYVDDECAFRNSIPEYLFFIPPPLYFLSDFVSQQHAWIWLVWLLSQAWITVHIWTPNCEKLATTEKLFVRPMYDAFLIDQSIALNRRRNETSPVMERTDRDEITDLDPLDDHNENITRIYACGTMWHETKDEIMEFLKSIFRLDQDQCANRIVRKYLHLNLPSYYEFETQIFFDDAYIRTSEDDNDPHLNEYVELLVSSMDEAAEKVHGTTVKVRPPTIYPTPYGGRLVWTLPGKTKMVAHLKDKAKIRAKKRWSQVMYMYYLLGYRLMDNEEIPQARKQAVAENTYILALDGDIDFQPEALHLLVDYMKKNKGLGAACGRIHPVGSGGMVWYQMFEYAIGHWLQKATEHVIGCVLCSPGCFSLFRGKALMDDDVMRKYTTKSDQAAHYVQYDQGEDRWLCTLLLQRGYRVEYSAASDAYTHCPEGFNEFYNQRRRWMPSTMANIMDLLSDSKHTVQINENISMLYIGYQIILLVGTVLGPGTIFLMLVGAFVAAFGLGQWESLIWNLVPLLLFVLVCATSKSDTQLFFAGLISAVYGLIMMAVFVGVMLQISQDGFLAPTSLFFFCMAGEMIIAAMLHPKEFNCLKYGVVYYVTVPSMYMLLVIYSVFNMNNVSWGTREVSVVPKPAENKDEKGKKAVAAKPKTIENKVLSFLGANPDDNTGFLEFSISKLFRCMCCTYKKDDEEDKQLRKIQDSLSAITRKIDYMERMQLGILAESHRTSAFSNPNSPTMDPRLTINNPRTTVMEGSKANRISTQFNRSSSLINDFSIPEETEETNSQSSSDVVENSWFYDGGLINGDVKFLNRREETFWNELLNEYLYPYEDDKEVVAKDLKDLRDKMVMTFFMLNSLFVLVVFLLTLEKDTLHVNWPINPKVNFTYSLSANEFLLHRTYLQLEPIGFVFLIFFALLMVVQGGAMLVHRFGTFSQILTTTRLTFFQKRVSDMSIDEIIMADPLKMAKDLQSLRGTNDEDEEKPLESVDKRKTVSNLAKAAGTRKSQQIFELDKAFLNRIKNVGQNMNNKQADISDDRRKSVAWINQRRQTLRSRSSIQKLDGRDNLEQQESNL